MSARLPLFAAIAALPPRPTEIHAHPCKECPTVACRTSGIEDPESEEIRSCSLAVRAESVFPCAWRPEKLCKGYADYMGVTEDDTRK